MNERFLTYGAGRVALNGFIGALIMLIYSSHECTVKGIHHVYTSHLSSYLELGVLCGI